MGAVFVQSRIYDAFLNGPENAIDLFHGYTYSGHPMAAAASLATLDTYHEEGLLTRASKIAAYWEERVHALKGLPHVIDIRNIGLIGAIEFAPKPDAPGERAYNRFRQMLRAGPARSPDRRHHRPLAAAHHRREADR